MPVLNRGLFLFAAAGLLALLLTGAGAARTSLERSSPVVEAIVGLSQPPLATAFTRDRALYSTDARRARLDLRAPASVSYLRSLAAAQRVAAARIRREIPSARVRWHYRVVFDGMAVTLPASEAGRLAEIRGVTVYPNLRYHALLDRSPALIGAPALWGPALANAGNGIKIGIVDDGLDQSHAFFDPSGFTMPAGYPKGQTAFTTAKVIVARAFAPPSPKYKYATRPFDPDQSEHATHVAGIAAGDNGTVATTAPGRPTVSGVAPRAYLGNYKVLTIPTPDVGLDGNAAEITAGIEAAVRDGMDVINLSLGEPEIDPRRDVVVKAIDGAAAAGVVPAIAAGNDFDSFGRGSIGSPGSAAGAITAAAVTNDRNVPPDVIASFSSAGPTPVSLQLKPDVSAPGFAILSSVPVHDGSWAIFSGTSMATPHVAGAAALLRQRHPTWTVPQLKSALVLTGDPVFSDTSRTSETSVVREGGGLIALTRANDPKIFALPSSLSFGLLDVGASSSRSIELTDAGGGAGAWSVTVEQQAFGPGVSISVPATVSVPGALTVTASATADAVDREVTGFVVLTQGGQRRHIPFWFRVVAPKLGSEPHGTLARTGTYSGSTAGKPALVSTYRYPDNPSPAGIAAFLDGPEQIFRVTLARPVANFGVAILSKAPGVTIEPRVTFAGNENRLVGYTAFPLNLNPYLPSFFRAEPVSGAVLPDAGSYDVVFDTPSHSSAGRFTFRFWIGDTTPPTLRLLTRTTARFVRVSAVDRGSGVNPSNIFASVDGERVPFTFNRGANRITLDASGLGRGRHQLSLSVSDYQESKNMEDVPPILPNTRVLRTRFTLR